jgi:acylphosphatase
MTQKIQVKAVISGKVQGVFFRAETKRAAERIGVAGWVRNLSGGDVEAVFEGEEKAVDKIAAWCQKGPALSRVDEVRLEKTGRISGFKNFEIRY